jgi:hypothetical protein
MSNTLKVVDGHPGFFFAGYFFFGSSILFQYFMSVNDGFQRPTVANFLKYRLKPALVPVFLSSSAGVGLAIAGIPARLRLAGIPAPLARLLTDIASVVNFI